MRKTNPISHCPANPAEKSDFQGQAGRVQASSYDVEVRWRLVGIVAENRLLSCSILIFCEIKNQRKCCVHAQALSNLVYVFCTYWTCMKYSQVRESCKGPITVANYRSRLIHYNHFAIHT